MPQERDLSPRDLWEQVLEFHEHLDAFIGFLARDETLYLEHEKAKMLWHLEKLKRRLVS